MAQQAKINIPILDIKAGSPQPEQLKEFLAYIVKLTQALKALGLSYLFATDYIKPIEPTFPKPTKENLRAALAANNGNLYNRHKSKIEEWNKFEKHTQDEDIARAHIVSSLSSDVVVNFLSDINDESKSAVDILVAMKAYYQPASRLQASTLRTELDNMQPLVNEKVNAFASRMLQLSTNIKVVVVNQLPIMK